MQEKNILEHLPWEQGSRVVASLTILALLAGCVTMKQYEQLQQGMTYEEVVEIMGSPGQERYRTGGIGGETVHYAWVGWRPFFAHFPFCWRLNTIFTNGRLTYKTCSK